MSATSDTREHRFLDLSDPVLRYANVLFAMLRYWGQSMFLLIVGAVPAGLAVHALTGRIADWFAGAWLGLSFPLAIAATWLRSRRVHRSRLVIDVAGVEHHLYPYAPVRVSWSDVTSVRNTAVPGARNARVELIIEAPGTRIVLDSEEWTLGELEPDIERHVPITRTKRAS